MGEEGPTPYVLEYTKRALAGLAAVEPKRRREQLSREIDGLRTNPFPQGSKQLRSWTDDDQPVRRLVVGPYRALYRVDENPSRRILVLDIDHRKDVYR